MTSMSKAGDLLEEAGSLDHTALRSSSLRPSLSILTPMPGRRGRKEYRQPKSFISMQMDVYERVPEEDMKHAATVLAAFVYNAAMMDGKFPRKEQMKGPD